MAWLVVGAFAIWVNGSDYGCSSVPVILIPGLLSAETCRVFLFNLLVSQPSESQCVSPGCAANGHEA